MQRYVPSECAEHTKPFTAYVHTSRLSQKTTGFIISWIGRLKSWEDDPDGSGCCKCESDLVSRSTEAQPATIDLFTSEKNNLFTSFIGAHPLSFSLSFLFPPPLASVPFILFQFSLNKFQSRSQKISSSFFNFRKLSPEVWGFFIFRCGNTSAVA